MSFSHIPTSFFLVLGIAVIVLIGAVAFQQLRERRISNLESRIFSLEKQVEMLIRQSSK